MTFWLDAQLDPDLAAWLGSQFGIVVKPLREIGLRDEDDSVLIQTAQRLASIVVITKDEDFADHANRQGAPPQVVWLRCGNLSTIEMEAWLRAKFPAALARINAGHACVE